MMGRIVTKFTFDLPNRLLAEALYQRMYEEIGGEIPGIVDRINDMAQKQILLKNQMFYKTGSIAVASAVAIYILTRKVQPEFVAEIGTFVGRSTMAMAMALNDCGVPAEIYTCDKDNPFALEPEVGGVKIFGHPQSGSTEMLEKISSLGRKVDMMFIDGRLSSKDISIIKNISSEKCVYLFDDFEGIEKGVVNCLMFKQESAFARHILLPPMRIPSATGWDWQGVNSVAVLMPQSLLRLTNQ